MCLFRFGAITQRNYKATEEEVIDTTGHYIIAVCTQSFIITLGLFQGIIRKRDTELEK